MKCPKCGRTTYKSRGGKEICPSCGYGSATGISADSESSSTSPNLAEYKEQKIAEAGTSTIPSGIRKRWRERIVAKGWHELGEEGVAKYLDRYGQNIGAPKVIEFARQAEAEGCQEMARGFWRKAYELELGHAPPADDPGDRPAQISVPAKLTESDIQAMEARRDTESLTKALYYTGAKRESPYFTQRMRREAAEALARIDSVEATKALQEALEADDEQVRASAAGGPLGQIGGDQVVGPLIKAFKTDRLRVRQYAAWGLAQTGDARAVDALIEAASDDQWELRQSVTSALGKMGGVRAVETLVEALNDPIPKVRASAAKALGRVGDDRAVEPLIEALTDKRSKIAVIRALGAIGDVRAVHELEKTLKDPNNFVRSAAARALGQIGDVQATESLAKAARDPDESVRTAAVEALEKIGDAQTLEEIASQAMGSVSESCVNFDLPPELEAYRSSIETTIKPYIEISAQAEDNMSLWQSKFGGDPYLPKGTPYPKGPSGRELFLLAQINFAQTPELEPFPQEGILQFYVADDDLYGMNFDDLTAQEGFRVLYFPQVVEDEKELVTDFGFLPKRWDFPVSKPHSLTFVRKYAPISRIDYRFKSAIFGQEFPQSKERRRAVEEIYVDIFFDAEDKMGGYPLFIQYDPREKKELKEKEFEILLLQPLCGEWGDAGKAGFFIREEDLRRRNFSQVLYYWDCS